MPRLLPLLLSAALSLPAAAAEKTTDALSERHAAPPAGDHTRLDGEVIGVAPHRRAKLLAGMGKIHFPITTRSPEAQAFFNQGVAQLHTYYYYEAERSFREVARLDPECAMAYWGMAMANTNNDRRARAFLAQAEARRKSLPDREKKYLDVLTARYKEGRDGDAGLKEYIRAWEAITFAYPDDIEAKGFLAGAMVHRDPLSRVAVDRLIEEVLRVQPLHPGAHHYRIHLWDGSRPEQALASAEQYARAAPGIAHAWHMPGHIYNGLGRWREAAFQQEASARVDHAHLAANRLMPFQIHNYAHNQHYLIANLSHMGRVRDAVALSRNLVETPRDPNYNNKDQGWSAQRLGRASLMRIYVRYERWDDLLSDPLLDWSDAPLEQAWRAYSRGLAYLGKGDRERAGEEAAALDKLAADAAGAKPPKEGAELMEVARLELRGRLALAEGKTLEAFELLNRGAEKSDRYSGDLAGYPRPFHEALGQAHLQAQNWGLAEACFRKVLEKSPRTLVSLAGLAEACARAGKTEAAAAARRDFEAACSDADRELPLASGVRRHASGVGETVRQAADLPPAPTQLTPHASPLAPDTLGPLLWQPAAAPPFSLADAAGKSHALEAYRGQNLVLVFYLGGDCEACMDQLRALGKERPAFEKMGARLLAVSGDSPARNRKLRSEPPGADLPVLLSDPQRQVARRYGAWDEFEELPLHGTFLIDRDGKIRWHRISTDPFRDVEFLKSELARVNRLTELTQVSPARNGR